VIPGKFVPGIPANCKTSKTMHRYLVFLVVGKRSRYFRPLIFSAMLRTSIPTVPGRNLSLQHGGDMLSMHTGTIVQVESGFVVVFLYE
jgi:hypothetical protein